MQTFALVIAVVSTVAYHLVTKLVPAGAHPIASLMTAYVCGSVACAAILLLGLGLLLFRDRLTLTNIAGVLLCLGGLWLVSRD